LSRRTFLLVKVGYIRGTAFALGLSLCAEAAVAGPEDSNLAAVKAVCGRCHGEGQFMDEPRSWARWNDVFREMTLRGATGTQMQLEQVTTYFLDHLTTLNVNTDSAEDIAWVLDISEDAAERIVENRRRKPFSSLAQLVRVPGVNRARLEMLQHRIEF
jgi:DNA uptake protein ComE-like DNA-binding protein